MKPHHRILWLIVAVPLALAGAAQAGSPNGRAGVMPAYYDGELLTINFFELPDHAAEAVLEHNKSVNVIFRSEEELPGGGEFVSVIDAIQGEGFNPLWLEVEIEFTEGHTPRQLTSDTDVFAAAASGEITFEGTDEVYRCSVIGPKNPTGGSRGGARPSAQQVAQQPGGSVQTTWGGLKALYRH